MSSDRLLPLLALVALAGCFNEEIAQVDLEGELVLPGDLVSDPREAGVVYIGVYAGYDPHQLGYPYPSTMPRVGDNPVGDAAPYGGTSVGSFEYACYRSLRCRVVTGRFDTLDSLLTTHPVLDSEEQPIDDETMYDECQWYYGWNTVEEFTFLTDDLDFERDAAGDWRAPFRAFHTELPEGARVWGFADNDATTCTTDQGSINRRRSDDGEYWREGTNYADVLNFPDKYVTTGDLLSSNPATIEAGRTDGYEVVLDWEK